MTIQKAPDKKSIFKYEFNENPNRVIGKRKIQIKINKINMIYFLK